MRLGQKLPFMMALVFVGASFFTNAIISNAGGASTPRGTVTYAEQPGTNPNYIFPFMDCQYFSVSNVNQFQELMYRPLYWFGLGGSAAYVPSLSTANRPLFTNANRTVTIPLKGWRFADGQVVNARSVMFFLNLYKADPTSYCGYNSGLGIPDQVRRVSGRGNRVTIEFTSPVNPDWILYNYLSEITPLPDSWDLTASGARSRCATGAYGAGSTNIACRAVEKYLSAQSTSTATFTDAMWQSGVDGPWKLTTFDRSGNLTFQPNSRYSGPQKARLHFVKEFAYTSARTELTDLQAGRIDIGYVDPTTLPAPIPASGSAGPNAAPLAGRYKVVTGSQWNFNFAQFNFNPVNPRAALLAQLYLRQALQLAINQPGIIATVDRGYGIAIYGPLPPNTPKRVSAPLKNPYPFNLGTAKALLTSNGWNTQNGVMTCSNAGVAPGQCGAGVAAGATLNFKLVSVSGDPLLDQTLNAEIASWSSIGIQFSHTTASFATVSNACGPSGAYDVCSLDHGWTFAPGYYPSGESLFTPGAAFNVGGYSNAQMTSLVAATMVAPVKLSAYQAFAGRQLPVLFEPQVTKAIEIIKTLKGPQGVTPNPLGNFMPEYLYF